MATNIFNSRFLALIVFILMFGAVAAINGHTTPAPAQLFLHTEEQPTQLNLPVESSELEEEGGMIPPDDSEIIEEMLNELKEREDKWVSWKSSSSAIHGVVGTLGRRAHGQVRLNCGEPYNADSLTIITPKLPCGARVAVTVKSTGKTVVATVAGRWAPFNSRTGMVAWVSEAVTQTLGGTRDVPYDVALRQLASGQDPSTLPSLIVEALPAFSRYSLLSDKDIRIHAQNIAGECGGCRQVAGLDGLGVFISVESRREKPHMFYGLTNREQIIKKAWQYSWTMDPAAKARVKITMGNAIGRRIKGFVQRAAYGDFTADENAVAMMLKGATHYFACWINPPKWAYSKRMIYRIDKHIFFTDEKPLRRYTPADFACRSNGTQVASN